MAKDYYELLGMARNASDKEIRRAYRRLARQHHPDVNQGDSKAEARFKEINEAYQVLSDPQSRRRYDRYGHTGRYADRSEYQTAGNPMNWLFRSGRPDPGGRQTAGNPDRDVGGFGNLGDLFGDLFGSRRGQRRTAEQVLQPDPIEVPVDISLEEAYRGTMRRIQLPADPATGTPGRRLEVKVPPGVSTNSKVHIAARIPGRDAAQDLYLVVQVTPHGRFERKGDHLSTTVPISLTDAVLGGEVEVPTIKGARVALKVPPETQNGRTFRLKGQGMPSRKAPGQYGDLLATVAVSLPTQLSQEERKLFHRLRELRPKS